MGIRSTQLSGGATLLMTCYVPGVQQAEVQTLWKMCYITLDKHHV